MVVLSRHSTRAFSEACDVVDTDDGSTSSCMTFMLAGAEEECLRSVFPQPV